MSCGIFISFPSHDQLGQVGYFKSGNNLEFTNMTHLNKPDTIDLSMVIPFDNLDEEDEINIPQDILDQAVEMLFSKFGGTLSIPADKTSNSIDN